MLILFVRLILNLINENEDNDEGDFQPNRPLT